jgi:hypothetical protein
MWNQYVAFGYHQFDYCLSFAAKWKRVIANGNILEKFKIIWNEYSKYLIHQEDPTISNLYAWTHNIALTTLHPQT